MDQDANGVWTRRTAAAVVQWTCDASPVVVRGTSAGSVGAPDDGAKKSKSVLTRSGKLPYTA